MDWSRSEPQRFRLCSLVKSDRRNEIKLTKWRLLVLWGGKGGRVIALVWRKSSGGSACVLKEVKQRRNDETQNCQPFGSHYSVERKEEKYTRWQLGMSMYWFSYIFFFSLVFFNSSSLSSFFSFPFPHKHRHRHTRTHLYWKSTVWFARSVWLFQRFADRNFLGTNSKKERKKTSEIQIGQNYSIRLK